MGIVGERNNYRQCGETDHSFIMKTRRKSNISDRNTQRRPGEDLSWMQMLFFLIGKPVKVQESVLHTTPWLTWTLAGSITLITLLAWYTEASSFLTGVLIFYPESSGWQWVTGLFGCAFIHADWMHLIGNLYFLYLFGRNVECRFGRRRMIWLFFISTALGSYFHGLFTDIGLIGASGGIFGILTFYALLFPKSRIMWLPFIGFFLRFFILKYEKISGKSFLTKGMPVRVFLVIYLLFQVFLLYEQLFAEGNVSAMAHLGGGLAGVVIFFTWNKGWIP